MDNLDRKMNELHKLINEYKEIVVNLKGQVIEQEYTQPQLEEWLAAEAKLDELNVQLGEMQRVAQDVKELIPKNGGKRKTRRNRKSKKSKTKKRKGKK
jgi:hypothetical protein